MADIDPDDPEFNEQLKQKIRQRFINQVGPFKVVDLIHQFNRDVLTDDDIERIKTSTRSHGNFIGAEELFNRLTQYRGWFGCLMSALPQVLPEVATKLAGDHDDVLKELSAARCHEVHIRDAKGCTSLPDAASKGHIGCIRDLIFRGEVELNSKNERGETAVYLAAEGGNIDCLEILIQAGCNVKLRNKDRDSPLYVSAKNGFPHCVEALIKAYAKPTLSERDFNIRNNSLEEVNRCGFTPVWAAAAKGHAECLKLLLEAGATANNCAIDRPDGFTPLLAATLAGKDECVQVLIKASAETRTEDKYGRTPLIIAVMEGRAKCLQVLIEAGADINTPIHNGESPLFVACGYRHFNCVSLLLSAGAEVHRVTNKGQTALMMAARSGDEESLQALIEAGSNLNAQDNDGKTALIIAAQQHMDICGQILVENGADIHLQDKLGRSAIHYAAVDYCLLLTILVDLGADVNAADNNGQTPLMVATRESDDYRCDVLRYLTMKGAKGSKNNNSDHAALVGAESYPEQEKNNRFTDGNSSSTCDVKENCSKDESSYKSDAMAPGSEMHHVHTLTRSYEVECCTEFEGSLQQSHSKCQKNPGHVGFIPITEFGLSHLPDKYRDERIVDVIKAEAELTVRLLVKYTSKARPDGYNASNMRGKKGGRVGSGWILGGVLKRTISENKKCPCPECENSADPQMEWMQLLIKTAIHVVYDSAEAKNTVVHIFADVDKPKDMHRFYGYDVCSYSHDDDECEFYAAAHDLQLYGYLESMVQHRRKTWRCSWDIENNFAAIVSHPHGCSKQITTGEWMSRFPAEGPSIKSKYIYNVPTCPGSSGAPVIVFRKNNSGTIHPHSRRASQDLGQNLSGSSSTEGPIFGANPIIGRYCKAPRENTGTGKFLPKGWDTLIEPEQERPTSPVQLLYDYQQRPPPPPSRPRPRPPPPPPTTTTTTPAGP